ncbi:MAG: hypothetical protein WC220_07655, partial [Pedobacter sp.]
MKTIKSSLIFFISPLLIVFFLFASLNLSAQEHALQNEMSAHSFRPLRASLAMYHTYIGTETAGDKKYLIVPSLGFDLEYWFNEKFGIGSHNDLELISFEVEEAGHTILEREKPLLLT